MFDLVIWSLVVIVWAVAEGWPPLVLMWVCWGQGVCFGIFIFLRALFTNQRWAWVKYGRAKPARIALVYIGFYPFFYVFYFYGLRVIFEEVDFDHRYIRMILVPTGLYFLSHLICLVYRIIKGEEAIMGQDFFNRALFFGLLPMHIMILGGLFLKAVVESKGALVFLLVLKLLAATGTFVYSIKESSR